MLTFLQTGLEILLESGRFHHATAGAYSKHP
jgi:hypothetical protein